MKKENQKVKLSEKIGMLMVCAGNIPLMTPFIRIFYDITQLWWDWIPRRLRTCF